MSGHRQAVALAPGSRDLLALGRIGDLSTRPIPRRLRELGELVRCLRHGLASCAHRDPLLLTARSFTPSCQEPPEACTQSSGWGPDQGGWSRFPFAESGVVELPGDEASTKGRVATPPRLTGLGDLDDPLRTVSRAGQGKARRCPGRDLRSSRTSQIDRGCAARPRLWASRS